MANLSGFNADEHEGAPSFEPMPKGWYTAMITESDNKTTKAGDGTYLALTFEIEGGEFKGRKVWANLNLNNPNEKAVAISRRNLGDICRAVGVPQPEESEELHYKPLAIYVVQKEFNGETKNEIKGFRALGGESAKAPSTSTVAPAAAAASVAKKGAPPWQRKAGA
jgi:hypothetical protein